MKDDNQKLEFEDKLQNIISKARGTDIDNDGVTIFCSSVHALLMKYLYANEYRYIVHTIRDISNSGNPEKFLLLIDMIEVIYCPPRKNEIPAIDKERKIHDVNRYLDDKEIYDIFDFSDKHYNIIGNLLYKRYIIQKDDYGIKLRHEIFDLYRNCYSGNDNPLKYSIYDSPTRTEVNRYILALVYIRDIGYTKKDKSSSNIRSHESLTNSYSENLPDVNRNRFVDTIVWEDVVKHIQINGIETKIRLSSLSQVDFNGDLVTRLRVVSVPEVASIWLDGRDTGWETNSVLELMPGKHIIELKLDGYRYAKREVELTLDNSLEVEFQLEEGEPDAYLTFGVTDPDVRYVHAGNNIVLDTKTGLEWLAGPDSDTDWHEAKFWLSGLKIGGGVWRMPALAELECIYEIGLGNRNITPRLEMNGMLVWSNETTGGTGDLFNFLKGSKDWAALFNSENNRVFAVRSRSDYL